MEKLAYLQLEIPSSLQKQTYNNLQNLNFFCNYSQFQYKHEIHSANSQLNFIADLLINFVRQLSLQCHDSISGSSHISKIRQEQHDLLKYLTKMIDEIYALVKKRQNIDNLLYELKMYIHTEIQNQVQILLGKTEQYFDKIKQDFQQIEIKLQMIKETILL